MLILLQWVMLQLQLSPTVEFPYLFTIYTFLFALTVLYYLLLSPNFRALVIQYPLQRLLKWAFGPDQHVRISGIGFALLSGKIYLNHVEYRTKNICVRILQSTVRINWWFTEVREEETKHEEKLPCRLSLEFVGFEYIIYHNSYVYDQLTELIFGAAGVELPKDPNASKDSNASTANLKDENEASNKQQLPNGKDKHSSDEKKSDATKAAQKPVSSKQADSNTQLPIFYRYFPVNKITIRSLNVMIGNAKLPNFLVFRCASAQILHSTGKAISPHARYQLVTEVKAVTDAAVYLQANDCYKSPEELKRIKADLDQEDYFVIAIATMSRMLREYGPLHSEKNPRAGNNQNGENGIQMSEMHDGQTVEVTVDDGLGLGFNQDEMEHHPQDDSSNAGAAGVRRRKGAFSSSTTSSNYYSSSSNMHSHSHSSHTSSSSADSHSDSSHHSSSSKDSNSHSHEREFLLECGELSCDYSYDVADALTDADVSWISSHLNQVPAQAAKQRLGFEFRKKTRISYGPWMEHQRALLMSYFKPWNYRNQQVFKAKTGESWPYTSLVIDAVFLNDESNIRMPYRDLNRIMESLSLPSDAALPDAFNRNSLATNLVEITFKSDSWLSYDMGWAVLKAEDGSNTKIKSHLQHAVIWTLLPSASTLSSTYHNSIPVFQPLLESELVEIGCELNYPTLWNAVYVWTFNLNFHTSKVFYYSNHIDLFKEFSLDWNKYNLLSSNSRKVGGKTLSYFVPSVFTYNILFSEYEVYLNVNENNVMDVQEYPHPHTNAGGASSASHHHSHHGSGNHPHGNHSSTSHSSHSSHNGVRDGFYFRNMKSEFVGDHTPSSAIQLPVGYGTVHSLDLNSYIVLRGPDLMVRLTTPWTEYHARHSNISYEVTVRNIRAHLSLPKSHSLTELVETKNAFQFLYINTLTVKASYMAHYKYNPDYRDSHTIALGIEGGEADAFGYYLRYLWNFKNNFFGDTTNWISRDEYRKYGFRNIMSWNKQIKYYGGGAAGGLNVNLNMGNPTTAPSSTGGNETSSGASSAPNVSPATNVPNKSAAGIGGNSVVIEERNVSETYFTLLAENLALNLPLHLFSNSNPSQQPKVRCYTVQLEIRSIQQYFDFMLNLSPLTITVPLNSQVVPLLRMNEDDTVSLGRNRSWNEKETFIHMKDFIFSWNQSKGDLPRLTVYRSLMKFGIGSVLVQLFPQQILVVTNCLKNLVEQFKEGHDHTIISSPGSSTIQMPSFGTRSNSEASAAAATASTQHDKASAPAPASAAVTSPTFFSQRESPEEIQIKTELSSYLSDLLLSTRLADSGIELNVGSIILHMLHPPLPSTALTVSMAQQAMMTRNLQLASRGKQQAAASVLAAASGHASAGPSQATSPTATLTSVPTAHLSLTRVVLAHGVQLSTSSLITPQSHAKTVLEVPGVDVSYLICADLKSKMPSAATSANHAHSASTSSTNSLGGPQSVAPNAVDHMMSSDDFDISRWVAICQIKLGLTLTNANQRSDWLTVMRKQQDFIYSQMHQEGGPMDDTEAYPWHESNANKVPYVLVDDVSIAVAAGALDSQMITHQQQQYQHFLMHQQALAAQLSDSHALGSAYGVNNPVYFPAHHHQHPRMYRPRNNSQTSNVNSNVPGSNVNSGSNGIEKTQSTHRGGMIEVEDEDEVKESEKDDVVIEPEMPTIEILNSVAEEDEVNKTPTDRDNRSILSGAWADTLPPGNPSHSREHSAPLSGGHYLSHVRQRSLQISKGGLHLRRSTVLTGSSRGSSASQSPAMHSRAASQHTLSSPGNNHRNLMSSREGQPSVPASDRDEFDPLLSAPPINSLNVPLQQSTKHRSGSYSISRTSGSAGGEDDDEDFDEFESCQRLSESEDPTESMGGDSFYDFAPSSQIEGRPNLAPLSPPTDSPQNAAGESSKPRPSLSINSNDGSAFFSPASLHSPRSGHSSNIATPVSVTSNTSALHSPHSPSKHRRSRSTAVGGRFAGASNQKGQHTAAAVAAAAASLNELRNEMNLNQGISLSPDDASILHLPNYVAPLPTSDLQAYLEHYALDCSSHAFLQGASRGDRRAANLLQSSHMNKATVIDASLAGTSAGAYLSLPMVSFEQLTSSLPGEAQSTSDDPFDATFSIHTTSYSTETNSSSAYPPTIAMQPSPAMNMHLTQPTLNQPRQPQHPAHQHQPASFVPSIPPSANPSRRGSINLDTFNDSLQQGVATPLPAASTLPPSRPVRERSHSVNQPIIMNALPPKADIGSAGTTTGLRTEAGHATASAAAAAAASTGSHNVTVETNHSKNTVFNTSKLVLEFTSDVTVMLCPSFIANMDQYLPFLQASYTTVEDTLDELHMQFTRAFGITAAPVALAYPSPINSVGLHQSVEHEHWHTSCVQRSIILPRLYVELLQSSVSSVESASSNSSISGLHTASLAAAAASSAGSARLHPRRNSLTQPILLARDSKAVIYATTLCVEGVTANIAQSYPLPTTFLNHTTGISVTNMKPLPSATGQISANKCHAYSCILNPSRYCGKEEFKLPEAALNSTTGGTHSRSNSKSNAQAVHMHSAACWGPNSIAIPQRELESLLPPAILSTSAVFVSVELNNTVVSFQHATQTELNPLYAKPVVAQLANINTNGNAHVAGVVTPPPPAANLNASSGATSDRDDSPLSPPNLATVRHNHLHVHAPSISANIISAPSSVAPTPTAGANATGSTPLIGGLSPVPLSRRASFRTFTPPAPNNQQNSNSSILPPMTTLHKEVSFGYDTMGDVRYTFAADDGKGTILEETPQQPREEELAEMVTASVAKSSFFLNPATNATLPSPATLNVFNHSHTSMTRLHVDNVAVLSGWDAPSRAVTVTQDWVTALGQLELVQVAREWLGNSTTASTQEEEEKAKAAAASQAVGDEVSKKGATSSTAGTAEPAASSDTSKPNKKPPSSGAFINAVDPALALFVTLPGGPATALRRSRWQTLLAFALQHVVHSRALDENKSGSKAFGEVDQLRLLQWLHHRVRSNLGFTLTAGRGEEQELLDEIGVTLQTYGLSTVAVMFPPRRGGLPSNEGGVLPADLNFIQSRAAPLTLALRKLLKLPPSLMRRLNFKLQRSDEGFAPAIGPLGAALGTPLTTTNVSGDVDFVKLYESEKLEASELARLTLHVFALLAPQAAKVRSITRPSDLSPALWQSVNHTDFHRGEVDQREIGVEWELLRVRMRVTHAPNTEHHAHHQPSSSGSAWPFNVSPNGGPSNNPSSTSSPATNSSSGSPALSHHERSSSRRDHAISINTLVGIASFQSQNSFTRLVIHPHVYTRGAMPPNLHIPREFHIAPNQRPSFLRSQASRALTKDVKDIGGSPTPTSSKLSVMVSPATPTPATNSSFANSTPNLFATPSTLPSATSSSSKAQRSTSAWMRDKDVGLLQRTDTIHEGSEESKESTSYGSGAPAANARRLLDISTASPSPSPPSGGGPASVAVPLSFPLTYSSPHLTAPTPITHIRWSLLQDLTASAHASDILVDVGPDIHRFLASLVAATFVFAEIHKRNIESTKNAARRMKNHAIMNLGENDMDSSALFEQEAAAAAFQAKEAQHQRQHHSKHGVHARATIGHAHSSTTAVEYTYTPFVTFNYFLQASVDTVGVRARVPGTAALHIVTQGASFTFNSFKPMSESELDSKQRHKSGVGGKKTKGASKKATPSTTNSALQTAASKIAPAVAAFGRTLGVGGSRMALSSNTLPSTAPAALGADEEEHVKGHPSPPAPNAQITATAASDNSFSNNCRMTSSILKMLTLDIRLMDQDIDGSTLEDMAHAAQSNANSTSGPNATTSSTGATSGPTVSGSATKKKGTVLFSLFLRLFAFNMDQALLTDALELNKSFLASTTTASASGSASGSLTNTPAPLHHHSHHLSHHASIADRFEAGLGSSDLLGAANYRPHSQSAAVLPNRAALFGPGSAGSGASSTSTSPAPASTTSEGSSVVSTMTSVRGNNIERLMVVINSEQSVFTLPFHQLEKMHVHDYIDPWKPVVAVFNASSALDAAKAEEEAEAEAARASAEATQAEGYTSAAFAWMRGESARQQPKVEAAAVAVDSALPMSAMSTYLSSTSASSTASYTHWSILCQLRGVSVVMLPLATVMFTYHLDRMYFKLTSPKPQEIHLLVSVGQELEKKEAGAPVDPDLEVSTHKITLHSANVKKKKPTSHDGYDGDGRGGLDSSRGSDSKASHSGRQHPLEKPPLSSSTTRGIKGAKYLAAAMAHRDEVSARRSSPGTHHTSLPNTPHNATGGGSGVSGGAASSSSSSSAAGKMQFVLEFRLPTVRASLRIREHDLREGHHHHHHGPHSGSTSVPATAGSTSASGAKIEVLDSKGAAANRNAVPLKLSINLPVVEDEEDSSSEYTSTSSSSEYSDSSSDSDDVHTHGLLPTRGSNASSKGATGSTGVPRTRRGSRRRSSLSAGINAAGLSSQGHGKSKSSSTRPHTINEIDGLIAVGSMSNHLDENVLSRLLHLQSTLNTEVNQLLDKFAQYSKEAGLEDVVGSFGANASNRRGSLSKSGAASGAINRRASATSASPELRPSSREEMFRSSQRSGHRNSSPAFGPVLVERGSRAAHTKRLSTLEDLHIDPSAAHEVDTVLSPISAAFKASHQAERNAGYQHMTNSNHLPVPQRLHPLLARKGSPLGPTPQSSGGKETSDSHSAPASAPLSTSSLWDRYIFNVNVVFENIHITAGLSSKKTAIPSSKSQALFPWPNPAIRPNPLQTLPLSRASSVTGNAPGSTSGGTGPNATGAATGASAHEKAAYFQPILHVTTGTFSLSMRYRPKAAIKSLAFLSGQKDDSTTASKDSNDPTRPNLKVQVDKKTPPESSGPAAKSRPSFVSPSGFKLEDGSNVIVEMAFQGIGLKMTTLSKLPLHSLFPSAAAFFPTSLTTAPSVRRTLVECRADIRLRVGFKVNASYTYADCTLEQTLTKVTAIPITTASIYLLASTYMKAYADFQIERARLVQEKEIRDPLIGLRALKADRVWSHLQSEFPAIKNTISAATAPTPSNVTEAPVPPGGKDAGHVRPTHRRVATDSSIDGSLPDVLSPTSAAAAVAVAAGQENPAAHQTNQSSVQIGQGVMIPLSNTTGPQGTKYELHFCMQATELVLLFEKDGAANSDESIAAAAFASSHGSGYDPAFPFGQFNAMVYDYSAYTDPSTSGTVAQPNSLSALVVFLDELDITLDYAPPAPTTNRLAGLSLLNFYPGPHQLSFLRPVNSLGSVIRVTGLELGCPSEDIPDTNILDDLAGTLRKYRAQPAPSHAGISTATPRFDALGLDSMPLSPREPNYSSKYPYRSYSLHTPTNSEPSRNIAVQRVHVYNRIVVRSTVFHVRGALPVTPTFAEEAAALTNANRATNSAGPSSGAHSRHRSLQWNHSPLFTAASHAGSNIAGSPLAGPMAQNREMTLVVDTSCSGAELDIDPSLVNHLSNLTSLVDLLGQFAPPDAPNTNQSAAPSLSVDLPSSSAEGLSSPSSALRRNHSSNSLHARSRSLAPTPSHRASHGGGGDEDPLTPSPIRGRLSGGGGGGGGGGRSRSQASRRRSLPSGWNHGLEVDGEGEDNGRESLNTSATSARPPTPSNATTAGELAPVNTKLDLSVEFKLNIEHGRCCLHPLPKSPQQTEAEECEREKEKEKEKGRNGFAGAASAFSSSNGTLGKKSFASVVGQAAAAAAAPVEELYADFVLPSINSSLIMQSVPKEEILVMLDLNLPPLTLNPSIMSFMDEVRLQFQKIEDAARSSRFKRTGFTATRKKKEEADDSKPPSPSTINRPLNGTADTSQSKSKAGEVLSPGSVASSASAGPPNIESPGAMEDMTNSDDEPVAKPPSGFASFIQSCSTAGRSITVNVRVKNTFFKMNCLPMNDNVYLQFGSKRNIDMCFTIAALDQQKLGLIAAIPYWSLTVHVPAIFVQLGLLHATSPGGTANTGSSIGGPTFLDVRCRHMKMQMMEAYHIRRDSAPIRTVLFQLESISPALITMNVISAFVVFSKVWLVPSAAASNEASAQVDSNGKTASTATPAEDSPEDTSKAVVPYKPKKYTAARASYYYLLVGKIEAEVNMLDVKNVHNKQVFAISRLCSRILDVGGSFPRGCSPLMMTLDSGELFMQAEAEAEGMSGKFSCPKGLQLRVCRLPLQVVYNTSFDFFQSYDETDSAYSGTDGEYSNNGSETGTDDEEGSNGSESDVQGDWSDREQTDAYGESETSSPAFQSTRRKPKRIQQLMSRQGKRMVNMLELDVSDTSSHFHCNHGLTQLLVTHSSNVSVSLLDAWNDRVDSIGYIEEDGDWSVKLYGDVGERLTIEASSRALPYFLEILTHLIAFTQDQFARVELKKPKDGGPVRTPFPRHRRARSGSFQSNSAIQTGSGSIAPTNGSPLTSKKDDRKKDLLRLNGPTRPSLLPTSPTAPTEPAAPKLQPLRAGVLSLHGAFVELKLGSDTRELEREYVCVEVHDFNCSLQRSLFYSTAQLKQQDQLLQLKRKRQQLQEAALYNDRDGFGEYGNSQGHLHSLHASSSLALHTVDAILPPEQITTEEELSVAIALLDEETDPLKRLKKRSNDPYRGGLLRPFLPLDVYRTLLVDIGAHRKIDTSLTSPSLNSNDRNQQQKQSNGYMWVMDSQRANSRSYISQLGANGPGIYVSRLSQSRQRDADDMDHICRIPGFVLEMETLDALEASTLKSRFVTVWDKSITVAIDVRVYRFLQNMGLAFAEQFTQAIRNMEQQAAEAQAAASRALRAAQEAAEKEEAAQEQQQLQLVKGKSKDKQDVSSKRSVRFQLSVPGISTTHSPSSSPNASPNLAIGNELEPVSPRPGFMGTLATTKSNGKDAASGKANGTDSNTWTMVKTSPPAAKGELKTTTLLAANGLPPSASKSLESPTSPRTRSRNVKDAEPGAATSAASSASTAVPPAPKLHKVIDPVDSYYDLNNPAIHVLDHSSSGISVRRIIDIVQSLNSNLKAKDLKKEEKQLIPAATHELTEILDSVLAACVTVSKKIDRAFER